MYFTVNIYSRVSGDMTFTESNIKQMATAFEDEKDRKKFLKLMKKVEDERVKDIDIYVEDIDITTSDLDRHKDDLIEEWKEDDDEYWGKVEYLERRLRNITDNSITKNLLCHKLDKLVHKYGNQIPLNDNDLKEILNVFESIKEV